MENAFAWINAIFDYFGQFVPKFFLISWNHRGVRYRRGKFPTEIKPGLHWYWPITTHVEKTEVVPSLYETPPTTLTTRDGKPLSIGYTIMYQILDIVLVHTSTDDFIGSLGEMAELPMAQIVHANTELKIREMAAIPFGKRGSLDGALTKKARRMLKPYGVHVIYCRVGFNAPTRVIKLLQEEK